MKNRLITLSVPLFLLAGCAGELSASSTAGRDEADRTTALVIIERTASAADVETGSANARFVRYPSKVSRDDALRRIGATLDLPALGTCAPLSSLAPVLASSSAGAGEGSLASGAPLQLLDVGAVTLAVNGVQTDLLARHLPDVTDLVSGVVYSHVTVPEMALAKAEYRIDLASAGAASSNDAVGRFAATAPDDLQGLRAGDTALVRGEAITVPVGGALPLHWNAGGPGDIVYVDVRPTSGSSGAAFARCAFRDTGTGVIPPRALAFDDGSVTVHRLHEEVVSTSAFDTGEIRFDFARTFSIARP